MFFLISPTKQDLITKQERIRQQYITEQKIKIAWNPQEARVLITLKPKDEAWGPDPPDEEMWNPNDAMFLVVKLL